MLLQRPRTAQHSCPTCYRQLRASQPTVRGAWAGRPRTSDASSYIWIRDVSVGAPISYRELLRIARQRFCECPELPVIIHMAEGTSRTHVGVNEESGLVEIKRTPKWVWALTFSLDVLEKWLRLPTDEIRKWIHDTHGAKPIFHTTAANDNVESEQLTVHQVGKLLGDTRRFIRFLETEQQRVYNVAIADVLEHGITQLRTSTSNAAVAVRRNPFTIELTNLSGNISKHIIPPSEGPFLTLLNRIAVKMRAQEHLAPFEQSLIDFLLEHSNGFRPYLDYHLTPLLKELEAYRLAKTYLYDAAKTDARALRAALFAAMAHPGEPIGFHMPGERPLVLQFGTRFTGLGDKFTIHRQPQNYIGPFHFSQSHAVNISARDTGETLPSLLITDRQGNTFHFTTSNLDHVAAIVRYFREHPRSGGHAFRKALFVCADDLMAAWMAVGLTAPTFARTHLRHRAETIRHINWGIGLLHEIDHLWEKLIALRNDERIAHRSNRHLRRQVRGFIDRHIQALRCQYEARFDGTHLPPFVAELENLATVFEADAVSFLDILAAKQRFFPIIDAQVKVTLGERPWLPFPGTRATSLIDNLRFLLAMPAHRPGGWLREADVIPHMQTFVADMQRSELVPSLPRAIDRLHNGSYDAFVREVHFVIEDLHIDSETRMQATATLIIESSICGDWREMEYGLRSMAQAIIRGEVIREQILRNVEQAVRDTDASQYLRIPTALNYALATIRTVEEQLDHLMPLGELASRIADAVPLPLITLDALPEPNVKWNALPDDVKVDIQRQLRRAHEELIGMGMIEHEAPGILHAAAVLTDDEFPVWLRSMNAYGSTMMHLRLRRRVQAFRQHARPIVIAYEATLN